MLKNQLDFITRYLTALKSFDPLVSAPIKKLFLFNTLLVLGVVATNTLMIWLIGKPFGYMMQQNFSGLVATLSMLALVIVINQLFHYQNSFRANVLGLRFVGELRNYCLQQICRANQLVTNNFKKGDLLTRLSDDTDLVQRFVIESPLYFISHLLTFLFYGLMLVIIDWQLALIVLLLTPLFFLHQKFYAKAKAETSKQFFRRNGRLLSKEDEILTNLRLVKAFNAILSVVQGHKQYFSDAFNWAVKERKLNASFNASLAMIVYMCALLVVYFGIKHIESNLLSVPELVSFLIYMGYLSVPIRGIADLGFQVQSDIMAGNRVLELFQLEKESHDPAQRWRAGQGAIEIDDVSYQVGTREILSHVSLNIDAGRTYAIVGESGVGKSTIAQLLLGFITPGKGEIRIDGKSILEINKKDLRESIAIVWQNPLLFSDSIRENLLLANQNATTDELKHALQLANASEFVESLPKGLDAEIAGNGIQLSGGQKQRLQVAQAILRNPEVLILDEATSALDSMAEEQVITNIRHLRENKKTTLLITHRYSAIKYVDQIIYLNADGSVTQGTHEHLIHTHKGYQHAIRWQTQPNEANKTTSAD